MTPSWDYINVTVKFNILSKWPPTETISFSVKRPLGFAPDSGPGKGPRKRKRPLEKEKGLRLTKYIYSNTVSIPKSIEQKLQKRGKAGLPGHYI